MCFYPRVHTGRDLKGVAHCFSVVVFLPTRPHGTRLARASRQFFKVQVSTHASTRDATTRACNRSNCSTCFYPRVHTGRDKMPQIKEKRAICFYPRVHTGRDSPTRRCTWKSTSFYPRVHTGRDHRVNVGTGAADVSTHASTRDATGEHS